MIEAQTIERAEGGGGGSAWIVNHLPTILWQRRYYVVAVFAVLFLAGVITAYTLPTLYRSSATLLVESPELPQEVVETPGTARIEERLAKIREQVLSRGDLISLIEQNNLYPDERRSQPMSAVVEKMRKATTVGALSGGIGSSGGSGNDNVIAINMSFDYPEPDKAQAVMQAYATQFLRMNTEQVEDEANMTVRFLQEQASTLLTQIRDIEGRITALKVGNGAALAGVGVPSFMDTGSYTAQITSLENQNRQLMAQLRSPGQANPQIAQAEAALVAAQAMYSDSHPDVVQARERLALLRRTESGSGGSSASADIQEQIRANNAAIASLTAARNEAVGRVNATMANQARAPAIMEQAMQLENRANTLRGQYSEVAKSLMRAQNSARLAQEQRGERLSLVEPPSLPDSPHWPNRPLLIAAGAAAGLALGLLLALAVELLSRPLRSPSQLEGMGLPVLGVVPVLQSNPPRKRFGIFKSRRARFA